MMAGELRPRCGGTRFANRSYRPHLRRLNHRLLSLPCIYRDLIPIGPNSSPIKTAGRPEMAQAAVNTHERAQPEALEVAVLDRDHLARMTFGDRSLEREVLQLFDRQSELLLERMRPSEPAAIATLAHTLKGSAVGIGATQVAGVAAEVEATARARTGECRRAIDELAQ